MEVKTEQFLRGKHVVVTVLELFLAFPRRLAFPMSVSEVLTSGLLLYTPPKSFSLVVCSRSLAQVSASVGEGCSHVVGHVDGVQLVSQEGVS